MSSKKPNKLLRAKNEKQMETWEEAAQDCGESFNSWACDALDAAAEFVANPQPSTPQEVRSAFSKKKPVEKNKSGKCVFFTPYGTRCKACGKVH